MPVGGRGSNSCASSNLGHGDRVQTGLRDDFQNPTLQGGGEIAVVIGLALAHGPHRSGRVGVRFFAVVAAGCALDDNVTGIYIQFVKTIRHQIKVVEENCTGCYRCERACPTAAVTMVGPKTEAIAVVDNDRCIACNRCIDSCDDDALLLVERDESIEVGMDIDEDDPAVRALCAKAGMDPEAIACVCSNSQTKEIAGAILAGHESYESLALATGVQSGCLLYCGVPIRRLLVAYTGEANSDSHVRRVPLQLGLADVPDHIAQLYPIFGVTEELRTARAAVADL